MTSAPDETEPEEQLGVEPITKGARRAAGMLGIVLIAGGTIAVFKTANQAGTALLLLAGAVFLLIAIQGTPLRRFGAGDNSLEMAVVRRQMKAVLHQVEVEGPPEVAVAVADALDPWLEVRRNPGRSYERAVAAALTRIGHDPDSGLGHRGFELGDRGFDAKVSLPTGQVLIEVKYRRAGAFGRADLARARAQALRYGTPTKLLIVTNAALSEDIRQFNATEYDEVVTWNDERDDDVLQRALVRFGR